MGVLIGQLDDLLALHVKNNSALAPNCEARNTSVPDFCVLLIFLVHTIPEPDKY
jgi:hypothetical protein